MNDFSRLSLANFISLALLFVLASAPSPAYAVSQIQAAYEVRYSPILPTNTCQGCHIGDSQTQCTLNDFGRDLAARIGNAGVPAQNLGLPEAPGCRDLFTAGQSDASIEALANAAMIAIESIYAPKISVPASQTLALSSLTSTTTASTTFDPGLNRDGSTSGVDSLRAPISIRQKNTGVNEESEFSVSLSGNTANITFNNLTSLERGEIRRAGGVDFSFEPENDQQFRPIESANLNENVLNVTFNNLQPIAEPATFNGVEGGQISGNVLTQPNVANGLTDRDEDGDDFQAVLVSGPTAGSFSTALQSNGSFVFDVPGAPSVGTITFDYKLVETSSGLESNTVTVSLEISQAPVTPPVAADDAFTTNEDTAFVGDLTAANPATADSVAAGQPEIDLQLVVGPALGTVTPTLVGGVWRGAFTYTPNEDASGTDTFVYTLRDADANNGTDTATVTITIDPVNDEPVAKTVTLATINEAQGEQTLDLLDALFVEDVDDAAATLTIEGFTDSGDPIVFSLDGDEVTYDPSQFEELDDDESVTFTFSYTVRDDDGAASADEVEITQTIVGLDNGLGRIAGEYANTLRGRYNQHFLPSAVQNDSCHSCHNVGQVGVEVEEVADCSRDVFNEFGFLICIDRDPGQGALVDLDRRLSAQEARFSPKLLGAPPLEVEESASAGTLIGSPLDADPGRNVQDQPTSIVDFAFFDASGNALGNTDQTGQFSINAAGQISVAGPLTPGVYNLDVRPINDAGQRDALGALKPGIPGFFPTEASLRRFVTITVNSAAPIAVDDSINVSEATATVIDVLSNDVGGPADTVLLVNNPVNGTLTLNANNTFTYTPNAGFTDTDSFVYRTSGVGGDSANATVSIDVVIAGGALAIADTATTLVNQAVTIDVLDNDLGNRPINVSIETAPQDGVAAILGDQIAFTPGDDFTGTVTMTYRATNAIDSSVATVTVEVTQTPGEVLEEGTNDPTLKPVARALGDSCTAINEAGGTPTADQADLLDICDQLTADIQNGANVDAAFSAIRNEEMLAINDMAVTNGRLVRTAVFNRLRNTRGGSGRGVDISGINVRVGEHGVSGADFDGVLSYLADGIGQNANGLGDDGLPIGVFLSGDIAFASRSSSPGESGFELTSISIIGGADYAISERIIVGAALGFTLSETDFTGDGGGLDANSYQLSVYGSVDDLMTEGLRLDGALTGGVSNYDSARRIQFTTGTGAVDRTAIADFNGTHINAVARLEYDLSFIAEDTPEDYLGRWDISAFGELDYLHSRTGSYTESGAGGLSLAVEETSFNSLIGEFGLHLGLPIETALGEITPFIEGSANVEILDDRPTVVASFAAVGANAPTFLIVGDKEDRLFGRFRGGATGEFLGADLTLAYETVFGRSLFRENSLSLSLGGPFVGADWFGIDVGFSLSPDVDEQVGMGVNLNYEVKF